jgi:nucleotide-binding universal stress UspA family protein
MRNVLVGVDGSAESERAAHVAASIARATGRGIVFTQVVPSLGALPGPLELTSWHRERAAQAWRDLDSLRQREAMWDFEPQTELLVGTAADMLAERATEDDVDLVVVGHRGRNAVARVLLGSVADRLMQICAKSVLVVR